GEKQFSPERPYLPALSRHLSTLRSGQKHEKSCFLAGGVDAKRVLPYNPACRRRDAPRCFPLIDGKSLKAVDLPGNRKETLVSDRLRNRSLCSFGRYVSNGCWVCSLTL